MGKYGFVHICPLVTHILNMISSKILAKYEITSHYSWPIRNMCYVYAIRTLCIRLTYLWLWWLRRDIHPYPSTRGRKFSCRGRVSHYWGCAVGASVRNLAKIQHSGARARHLPGGTHACKTSRFLSLFWLNLLKSYFLSLFLLILIMNCLRGYWYN